MFSLKKIKPVLGALIACNAIALPPTLATALPITAALAQTQDPAVGPDPMPSLSAVTEAKLLKAVAKQLRLPVKQLKVERSKLTTWNDGCIGVYQPGRGCTRAIVPGWQAVLTNTSPGREPLNLVLHLDKDATRIALNPTASGGSISPTFEQFGGPINPSLEPNLVFRSYSTGTMSGQTVYNSLTSDGKVTRLVTAPNIRSRPVLVRQLTPQQLKQFQQSLLTNRLPNLNGLSYLTSASFADAPTITFDVGSVVQYTEQDLNKTPGSLQRLAQDWNKLIK
jgi:hypothetical protein